MRNRNAKLFRPLFNSRQSYRKFKKAYTASPLEKRLETITMARKIKATGTIHHGEIS
jgi:hypothetical protein